MNPGDLVEIDYNPTTIYGRFIGPDPDNKHFSVVSVWQSDERRFMSVPNLVLTPVEFVYYHGPTPDQIRFKHYTGVNDPFLGVGILQPGRAYIIDHREQHEHHIRMFLREFPGRWFNERCFAFKP